MRLKLVLGLSAAFAIVCAASAAQDEPVRPRSGAIASLEKVKVYTPGKDVAAPELLPSDFSQSIADNCEQNSSGEIEFHFIVDANGMPANIQFAAPDTSDMNMSALMFRIMRQDRFKPATMNGSPVAAGQTVKIKLNTCMATVTTPRGETAQRLRLRQPPEQHFSEWPQAPAETILYPAQPPRTSIDSQPVPTSTVEPQFSSQARRDKIQGTCTIQFIVDADGLPQEPIVIKPLGHGLDQKALEAVRQYRFKPAMKDGQPVPVFLTVQISFRLY